MPVAPAGTAKAKDEGKKTKAEDQGGGGEKETEGSLSGEAQILDVVSRPIGENATADFCGVWHSGKIQHA